MCVSMCVILPNVVLGWLDKARQSRFWCHGDLVTTRSRAAAAARAFYPKTERQRGRAGEAGALRGRRGGASSSPAPPEAQRRYMSLHQHLTWKAMPNIIGT